MNDFGRPLEKEIPRLRRYARALGKTCSMKERAPSACGPGLAPRRQAAPAAVRRLKHPNLGHSRRLLLPEAQARRADPAAARKGTHKSHRAEIR